MKKIEKFLVSMAMFMSLANPVAIFAAGNDGGIGDIIVDVAGSNVNKNKAKAESVSVSSAETGPVSATGGTLNYTERVQLPVVVQPYQTGMVNVQIGSDTYGTSVAQFGNSDILGKGCRVWTMAKYRTKRAAMQKVEGSVSWDKMMDLIIAYPNIEKEFAPIGEGSVYLYDSIDLVKNLGLTEENFIGTLPYDTEISKKYFVPQNYLGERACYDGSQLFGANVVVKLGEFYNGHFIASGNSFGLSSMLTTVLNCVTGSGISAGAGTSGAKNSKVITTGAVYGLFRINGQPQPCKPVVDVSFFSRKIKSLEEGRANCKKRCINNFNLSQQIGDVYLAWHHVAPSDQLLHDAEAAYARAEENFLRGVEPNGIKTSTLRNAKKAMDTVYYNWTYAKLLLEGKNKADAFAGSKGLTEAPDKFEDLR